jgi:hypothetical protein
MHVAWSVGNTRRRDMCGLIAPLILRLAGPDRVAETQCP